MEVNRVHKKLYLKSVGCDGYLVTSSITQQARDVDLTLYRRRVLIWKVRKTQQQTYYLSCYNFLL